MKKALPQAKARGTNTKPGLLTSSKQAPGGTRKPTLGGSLLTAAAGSKLNGKVQSSSKAPEAMAPTRERVTIAPNGSQKVSKKT